MKQIFTRISVLSCLLLYGLSPASAQALYSVSGTVFNDANGNVVMNTGEPGINNVGTNLYAYLVRVSTGLISDTAHVSSSGTFNFSVIYTGAVSYRVELSTIRYAIGTNTGLTPISRTLPGRWHYTGERLTSAAAADATPDGSLTYTVSGSGDGFLFGLQRSPVADAKSYLVSNTAFSVHPPAGFIDISTPGDKWVSIQMNSSSLTGYASLGALSGNDPEDCSGTSSCNTGTGTSFVINTIRANTRLFYNFGGATGVAEIDVTGGAVTIPDFNVHNMLIWGQEGAGATGDEIGFTYAMRDAAGLTSTPVSYLIATTSPLPVALLSFHAVAGSGSVRLDWTIASGQDNLGFEIERSTNAQDWRRIGLAGGPAADGRGSRILNYSFTDLQPAPGRNLYRLKQLDPNGGYVYSPSRLLDFAQTNPVIGFFPNPVQDQLNISGLQGTGIVSLRIYDALGTLVAQQDLESSHPVVLFKDKAPGRYTIRMTTTEGTCSSATIIKR